MTAYAAFVKKSIFRTTVVTTTIKVEGGKEIKNDKK